MSDMTPLEREMKERTERIINLSEEEYLEHTEKYREYYDKMHAERAAEYRAREGRNEYAEPWSKEKCREADERSYASWKEEWEKLRKCSSEKENEEGNTSSVGNS